MEEDFPESRLDDELQTSKTEAMKDLNLQDQHNQNPESLKQGQELHSLHSSLDQVQVQDKARSQDEAEHETCAPDPPLDPVQAVDQSPTRHDCDRGRASGEESDDHRWFSVWDQDPSQAEQNQDPAQRGDQDGASPQDQDRHPVTATAYQEAAGESGGSVPALVITQAVEALRPQRPADLVIPVIPTDPGLSSGSDGGDMACSDLLSLRSDSLSLASEPTISRTSEDDDITSVAASSVMSLFQRVQLDPLEKHWLRSSALGNMAAQRLMLSQEPSLVLKKDFINTALHWAAKQGRQEAVDMMLRSGADVNVKSGYTALHLASIHGHQHVVHALINTYNAKTNIRDYHGKTAVHYWSGCSDAFDKPDTPSGARFSRGRWTQRYALPSMLLSRSRSQGQLNLDFGKVPQSPSHGALDLQL